MLNGAPLNTFDVDIVCARDESNVNRLMSALEEMEAVYRMQPDRKLKPSADRLRTTGHKLLLTKFGPLDVLGTIGNSRSYDDLLPNSMEVAIDSEWVVQVLNLATLIKVKEEVGAPKDLAVIPILRRTLEERGW